MSSSIYLRVFTFLRIIYINKTYVSVVSLGALSERVSSTGVVLSQLGRYSDFEVFKVNGMLAALFAFAVRFSVTFVG